MKKVLVATILVLIFALTCVAQEVCKRHTEPEGGFSFCPPDGWRIEQKTGDKYKMVFGTPTNGFTPNINIKEGSPPPHSLIMWRQVSRTFLRMLKRK